MFNNTDKLKNSRDPQRLSGLDSVRNSWVCDSPTLFERLGGRNNKTPRQKWSVGIMPKVTECRYTEDNLTRDKLAATASFVNCTGGLNGIANWIFAVVKSSLIDLEPEVAFS